MAKAKTPISEAIYYNYVQTIEKLKRQYEGAGTLTPEVLRQIELRARDINRGVIENIFTYSQTNPNDPFFNIFTREGNSRNIITNLAGGNPEVLRQGLTLEFMGKKPRNTREETLRNAVEATVSKYSINAAINAITKVFLQRNYDGFARRVEGQTEDINYRKDLMTMLDSKEIADVLLTSIINEHEKQRGIPEIDVLEKAGDMISQKFGAIAGRIREVIGKKHPEVENLQVHPNTSRVIAANDPNWQFRRGVDVTLGRGLYAASDIGNVRENQEDSVLVMYHPQNPAFKMLVVSDGMGGLANGEMASSFVVEQINQWFKALPPQAFRKGNTEALKQHFEAAIREINKRLHTQIQNSGGERAGATFCGAIVTEKETIISNVGDSRAYAYSEGRLQQITTDDNVVFLMQKAGMLDIEKDEIRFQQGSNMITQAMGLESDVDPRSTVINNLSYDCLMIVSDGVSDCLSDEQIKAITRNTPRDRLAQMLIQGAKARDSRSKDGTRVIRAGKDNASVALYDRSEMKREHER